MGSQHAILYCLTSAHAEPEFASVVEQAKNLAEKSGFQFDGSLEAMRSMIRENLSQQGDIYIDLAAGDKLSSRPGQSAFFQRACIDQSVALAMVSSLSRLSRDTGEVIQIIYQFYERGGKIVFLDDCADPVQPPNAEQGPA